MAFENNVQPNDVLLAMAASLVEKQPVIFNKHQKYPDKPHPVAKIGGKPPKEVFYRNTTTFVTQLPPLAMPRTCNCGYLCTANPAEFKCLSCSIYNPSGIAYYCKACFESRHPWYRVQHIYTEVQHDESIEHTLKVANRITEATRYEIEGKHMLEKLTDQYSQLNFIADDEKVDNNLRKAGRKITALEDYMVELRNKLQHAIQEEEVHRDRSLAQSIHRLPPVDIDLQMTIENGENVQDDRITKANITLDHALSKHPLESLLHFVTKIQAAYHGWVARRAISLMVSTRYIRIFSQEAGRGNFSLASLTFNCCQHLDYFYDRITGLSSWFPSKLLHSSHLDTLQYIEENVTEVKWACKKRIRRRRSHEVLDQIDSVSILIGFGRCILARRRVLRRANKIYRRVLDDETNLYYYINMKSGESDWNKPKVYLFAEPPVFKSSPKIKFTPHSPKKSLASSSNSPTAKRLLASVSRSTSDRIDPRFLRVS